MTTEKPGVLLDVDGVVVTGGRAIDGAAEALRALREAGHPLLLVTNTTSRSRAVLAEELRAAGLDVDAPQILNPMIAAREWIRAHDREPSALFVGGASRPDFEGIDEDDDAPRSVVIGDLREGWDYATMNRILALLLDDPDRALLALGGTRYWRADDGWRLDVGPFAAAFSMAADREAVICGKPAADFFHQGCRAIEREPADVVMVGDDVRSDVGGAIEAGLRGVLVRTGKFRPGDLDGDVTPDAVIDSVADLPELLARG